MERLYLEDLTVGQRFTGPTVTVTEDEIKAFAAKFDPQPFHLDDAAAAKTLFGGLAASGWHTAAMTMRMIVESNPPLAWGIIGGGGEIACPRPTRPGDVLHFEGEVLEIIPSKSKPDRGMAVMRSVTRNQNDETVQVFTMKLVVPRRHPL
jgi:acyl dehydratase